MTSLNIDSYVTLGRREKISYGLGDFASNLSFGFVSLFLLFFYTDIYGLTAAEASLIFVIARFLDGVFNLAIGLVIDSTSTKYGKLRPFLLYGSIPLGLLTVFCFTAFDTENKFIFALVSYTLYSLAYTLVNTPYSAMTNMLTQHEGSRASLSVYRFSLAIMGYLVVSSFASDIVALFDEPKYGYIFASGCFAFLSVFLFLYCFKNTKERVPTQVSTKANIRQTILAIYKNSPLQYLSSFTICVYIVYTLWMAIAIYYINYVLDKPAFTAVFFLIQTVAYACGTVGSDKLIALYGKKVTGYLAIITSSLGLFLQYFISYENMVLIMACVSLYSVGLGVTFVVLWSMVADTVEYSEWQTGTRIEGGIYGYFNFITKIAMAIGGGLSGMLLSYYEYNPETITSVAINGINNMMTIIPAAMLIISIIFIYFYSIDEDKYLELINTIAERKKG